LHENSGLRRAEACTGLHGSSYGPAKAGVSRLTPRQQEILTLLAKGFYYKEIGAALGISHSTVRAHLHTVYRKLEVKSRARAVIKFHEQNGRFAI
jgi:DNA-binding NarL/FixJ family response regulator